MTRWPPHPEQIRPGPLTQFPSKGQRRRMDISERRGSCRGMFVQFDDFFAMAVRTGRLDMRDANAQAKVEALAKTLEHFQAKCPARFARLRLFCVRSTRGGSPQKMRQIRNLERFPIQLDRKPL